MAGMIPTSPPSRFGRTLLIGGTIVAVTLAGFWANMQRHKRHQESLGRTPHYEQVMAHVNKKPVPGEPLAPVLHGTYSDIPPAFPGKDHHGGHITMSTYKQSPEYSDPESRYQVPTPQRGRNNDSGRAYTKSPDYVKNYEKTHRPGKEEETEVKM
ncbi:hypothetical protein K443DRAFT_619041 [Laccaria amethystina LaAM-08-1]|uniref:Unplaced genomic scaffold K443scaffold_99, whole genome shotgun sequence n=1 Tax=Laccaria amethystina LaAM-08-1 TaxID=1095629 RepID=A0A0C9XEL2_9AGAR|nr:hypothetical protein K443DRAFT_619041 [Laccaria amethystina LaAM-08-1]